MTMKNKRLLIIVLIVVIILLIPLLAMQFTDEVNWDLADFVVAGLLLIGTGFTYLLVTRKANNIIYRIAVGLTLATALLLVWINLAVGFIGDENNLANLMYIGVVGVGVISAIIVRFQPHGMSISLLITALTQALVAVIALLAGLGYPTSGPIEIVITNVFFITLWIGLAFLFRKAAHVQEES
jgi:hypothetical protein